MLAGAAGASTARTTRCCSEEAADDPARLSAHRVWIIDPLDGTREFSEPGRTTGPSTWPCGSAGELVAGAVTLPAAGLRLRHRAARPRCPRRRPARCGSPSAGPVRRSSCEARGRAARRRAGADGLGRGQGHLGAARARPTPTCTRAASTSGTRRRRSPWPRRPACTPAGSTAARWSTTGRTRCLPDLRRVPARARRAILDAIAAVRNRRTRRMTDATKYQLTQLQALEAEALFIMREVVAELERPVLLFSGGKDSIVMLRPGARRRSTRRGSRSRCCTSTPGTTSQEVLDFRDRHREAARRRARRRQRPGGDRQRLGHRAAGRHPQPDPDAGAAGHPRQVPASPPSSAAPGATRTRPAPRSGSSPSATSSASGTPRTSGPSCGTSTTARSTSARASGSSRCRTGPSWTSGATSSARASSCRSIYFAHEREVFDRDGMLFGVHEVCRPKAGETGRSPSGSATAPSATPASPRPCAPTPTRSTRSSTRWPPPASPSAGQTRGDDKFSEAAMEDRKKEGYF